MRRQIALTLARTPGLHQHLTHLLERDRSGDHPKADVVADTHAGWQCGGSSTHGAYSPPVHSRLGDKRCNVNRIGTSRAMTLGRRNPTVKLFAAWYHTPD